MHWSEQIFRYCERGHDPGLLAEPLNAASNFAFLVAALAAAHAHATHPTRGSLGTSRPADAICVVVWLMILLVALIGAGSFLLHTFATRWAQLADVVPIAAFMLVYLAFALRLLLGMRWPLVGIGLAMLVVALATAVRLCPPDEAGLSAACLNGTVAYLPALLAMVGVGMALRGHGHPAAGLILVAALVFLLSMAMRSADMALCDATHLAGHPRGLHVLWHLLNAAALYLLLMVAIRAARPVPRCQDRPDAA